MFMLHRGIHSFFACNVKYKSIIWTLAIGLPHKDKYYPWRSVLVMSPKVLVPIASGIEELEAVTIIDILRRAKMQVCVASVGTLNITASRGVMITADCHISDCTAEEYDLIAIPGGMPGAENFRDSEELTSMLIRQKHEKRFYAAICASPAVVLYHHGLLKGLHATCHPTFRQDIPNTIYRDENVVVDGNCITSKGPGTAIEFALKLVEIVYNYKTSETIAVAMCI